MPTCARQERRGHHQISNTSTGGRPAGPQYQPDRRVVLRQKRHLSSTWYHRWIQSVRSIGTVNKNQPKNFAGQKRTKMAKRTRKIPKKAKPGAFWVLESVAAVGDGCGRILLLEKCTPMAWWWPQQQKDLPAFLTKRCWLELPLKGVPSRRSSLKTCHRHVFLTLRSLLPPRSAQNAPRRGAVPLPGSSPSTL